MRRGLQPAAGPTYIYGVNLVPTVVVARGTAAAVDRQVPATGTCVPALVVGPAHRGHMDCFLGGQAAHEAYPELSVPRGSSD